MTDRWVRAAFSAGLGAFCAAGLAVGHHHPGIEVVLASVAAVLAAVTTVAVVRHAALARGLRRCTAPGELAGLAVRTGRLGGTAFVAGLARPTIYCDERVPDQLTDEELRAVLLHERAHQRAFDPVRLLVWGLITPALRRWTLGREWLESGLARREIAADRAALAGGARRSHLASALLKLPHVPRTQVAGFTPAFELRLQALLGDVQDVRGPVLARSLVTFTSGAFLGAALCTWVLHAALTHLGLVCC